MKVHRIILGSLSPFRKQLLAQTGLVFDVKGASIDEKSIKALPPRELAVARAVAKAQNIARENPETLVIGADQVLDLEGRAFDKAETEAEARDHLRALSGHVHYLHSAFVFAIHSGKRKDYLASHCISAAMTMRTLSESDLKSYLESGEWRGCVGCYRIEGRGINLFSQIEGDSSTIIGLPLIPILSEFRKMGIDVIRSSKGPWDVSIV